MGILSNLKSKVANAFNKVKNAIHDSIIRFNERGLPKMEKANWKVSRLGQLMAPVLANWWEWKPTGRSSVPEHVQRELIQKAQLKRYHKNKKRISDNCSQQMFYYNSETYILA